MKKLAYIVLGLSFAFLILSLLWSAFGYVEKREIPASVEVGESLAFDLNESALTFGGIARPGSSERNVLFENTYDFPILLSINVEGDIAELMGYENKVVVQPGESAKIGFSVNALESTEKGSYSGIVEFKARPIN